MRDVINSATPKIESRHDAPLVVTAVVELVKATPPVTKKLASETSKIFS